MKVVLILIGAFLFSMLFFSVSWFFYGVLIAGGLVIAIGGIHSTVTNMRERKHVTDQHADEVRYAIEYAQYERDLAAYHAAQAEAAKRAGWH